MFVLGICDQVKLLQNNVGGQWALINKHQEAASLCKLLLLIFIIIEFTYAFWVGLHVQFTVLKLFVLLFICTCDNWKLIKKNSQLINLPQPPSKQSNVVVYLVDFSKQKKNSCILNLQIKFVTHAKQGVCYCCCLQLTLY